MTSDPLRPQAGPVPHASSHISGPFWEGCRSHQLRYQRCDACGLTNVVGVPPEDLTVGMRVRVKFQAVGPDVTLPYFTGVETDSS